MTKTHERRTITVFKYGLDFLLKFLLTGFNNQEYSLFSLLCILKKMKNYWDTAHQKIKTYRNEFKI